MATIAQLLREAQASPRSDSWRVDTELLLMEAMGCSRATLLTWPEREVPSAALGRFEALLERRRSGEPIAYLLGRRGFWDFELRVSPAVLIPRPETELLVELAIDAASAREGEQRIVDLGTGSGAIAIALARANPRFRVTGVELSAPALALARENAARLAANNLDFIEGSWLSEQVCRQLTEGSGAAPRVDMIVSNPPYIAPEDPHLSRGDLVFEPRIALSCEESGMAAIARIINESRRVLKEGGWLLFEHGYDQREAVAAALREAGFAEVECHRDTAGNDRVTQARNRSAPRE